MLELRLGRREPGGELPQYLGMSMQRVTRSTPAVVRHIRPVPSHDLHGIARAGQGSTRRAAFGYPRTRAAQTAGLIEAAACRPVTSTCCGSSAS